jgi:uroporphyrin-III C-methyltransferase / precorrin-2 dehydrogenase / sirohydrochlorin ferrochelatase
MSVSRKPVEARAPGMEWLATLPVFLKLAGKRAVVGGGGPAAAWKAELLSAAGAHVEVYAKHASDELCALIADPPRGPIRHIGRGAEAADLEGAAIAVGAFEDDRQAGSFAAAARSAKVPVNLVDRPAHCDFVFGAIVNRSPLVLGISTDGASPVFAQTIRAKLEALIPRGFAQWVHAAQQWRPRIRALALPLRARRLFWELFAERALAHADRAPTVADLELLVTGALGKVQAAARGSVALVGAGPGNPELLTLRAVRALQTADVILIDDLVAPQILDFARREARKMLVGKSGHKPSCKQDEINALMISLAKSGRRVVRLKGGDPCVFGRAGEEIEACRAAEVPVELIPGITAAQAAASRVGASLTHRRHARRVQYLTGHAEDGRLPSDIDWRSIADPSATTVVYMPKRTLGAIAETAMAHGLHADTPAIAVCEATRPGEIVVRGTIADIAGRLEGHAFPGPAVVMIGRVFADSATGIADLENSGGTGSRAAISRGARRIGAVMGGTRPHRDR